MDIKIVGKEALDHAADMMSAVFKDDPVMRFMLSSLSDVEQSTYLGSYMRILFKAALLNDGTMLNINDWESCAIWMPPGKRVDNYRTVIQAGLFSCLFKLGIAGVKHTLIDYQRQSDKAKRQGLRGVKQYHYLFMIGTAAHARGKGLASRIIREHQTKYRHDNLPIWLESTSPHSRDIYTRCGFEVVCEMILGKGSHSANGALEKGGSGVRVWAMVWRPALADNPAKVGVDSSSTS